MPKISGDGEDSQNGLPENKYCMKTSHKNLKKTKTKTKTKKNKTRKQSSPFNHPETQTSQEFNLLKEQLQTVQSG